MFKKTVWKWFGDRIFDQAAALAYTTLFSMAPTLVLAIGLAGLVFGQEAAQGRVFFEIRNLIGAEGAETVQKVLQSAAFGPHDVWATVIGALLFLLGATAVFAQLKGALNDIWSVQPNPKANDVVNFFKNRLLSLAIVIACGFLLLVSLVISTLLASFGDWISYYLSISAPLLSVLNSVFSTLVIALFFAMLFKVLPDVYLYWSDVWVGALTTSILFSVGKYGIAAYIGNSRITGVYGAAGSLVVVVLWIYYSSLILLMGAVFTQVYTVKRGRKLIPVDSAVFFKREILETAQPPKPKPQEATLPHKK